MVKILFLFINLLASCGLLSAQTPVSDETRYISVTGSAEVKVQPDEIDLEIVLKEYGPDNNKTELASIEKQFLEILEKNRIPREKVTFNSTGYYWYFWWSYRNESFKEKRILVTLDKSTDFLKLMKDLDIKGVSSLRIASTTNEKLQELRKDVKIQAVKAAKDKATYLLESIGEKLGRVIAIEEVPDNSNYYFYRDSQAMSNVSMNTGTAGNEIGNVAEITLRYEIKAKFEIQE